MYLSLYRTSIELLQASLRACLMRVVEDVEPLSVFSLEHARLFVVLLLLCVLVDQQLAQIKYGTLKKEWEDNNFIKQDHEGQRGMTNI